MATLIKYTCAFTSIAFVTSTGKPNAAHSAIQSIAKGSEGTNAAHSNGQSAAQEASNSNVQATSIATTIATTIATAQSNAQEAVEVLEVQSLHPMLFAGFCAGYCLFHENAPPQIAAWTWLVLTLVIIYCKLI